MPPTHSISLWRRIWWRAVRCHDGEICDTCGRPVDRSTGRFSYWTAPDSLWQQVNGQFAGISCIPCFTNTARRKGIAVHWMPSTNVDATGEVERLRGELREAELALLLAEDELQYGENR